MFQVQIKTQLQGTHNLQLGLCTDANQHVQLRYVPYFLGAFRCHLGCRQCAQSIRKGVLQLGLAGNKQILYKQYSVWNLK